MFIPHLIDPEEELARFIFTDNFKKKTINLERIISGEIFLDTRNVGVSLQRLRYCSSQNCKVYGNRIATKQYVGMVIFVKNSFDNCIIEYQKERENFEAVINYSPLDENFQYLVNIFDRRINDEGNPSHSDLIYINPSISSEEIENGRPHTSLRLFSTKLLKYSKIIFDE